VALCSPADVPATSSSGWLVARTPHNRTDRKTVRPRDDENQDHARNKKQKIGGNADVVPQSALQDHGSWIQNLYEMVELGTGAARSSATLKRDVLANMASMLKGCDRKSNLASELRVSEGQLDMLIKLLDKICDDVDSEKSVSPTAVIPKTNNHRNDALTGEFVGLNFDHSESIQKVKSLQLIFTASTFTYFCCTFIHTIGFAKHVWTEEFSTHSAAGDKRRIPWPRLHGVDAHWRRQIPLLPVACLCDPRGYSCGFSSEVSDFGSSQCTPYFECKI
jgi:hypothetical protein